MNSRNDSLRITKVSRWENVARVFEYACKSCGGRPALEDAEYFLLAGVCRACGAHRESGAHSERIETAWR